jgi:hypothetical protein
MNKHYIYAYLDPRKTGNYVYGDIKFEFEPFYIGMGKNYRLYDHLNEAMNKQFTTKPNKEKFQTIKDILKTGNKPIIIKIKDLISEEEAKLGEIELITLIGRIDLNTGVLLNKTAGGDTHPILKGKDNPMFGKKWSEERKQLFSDFQKKRIAKIPSEQRPRAIFTEEHKNKMSKKFSGKGNPRWGIKMSQETKDLISLSHKENGMLKGENNPKAKKWKVIDPNNVEYIVKDGLGDFCKKHNLGCYNALVHAGIRKTPVTRGISKGWIAIEIA